MSPRQGLGLGLAALVLASIGGAFFLSGKEPPKPAEVRAAFTTSDKTLKDRYGRPLQDLRLDRQGRRLAWRELGEISPALVAAVLKAEDRHFYQHGGVDWPATFAAGLSWISGDSGRGASTLSMQLAALIDPGLRADNGGRRTALEKLAQMRAALRLEHGWSKPEILDAYLNLVSFRGELQGVDAAARGLFGKAPHGLDADESLLLASLIRAPNARPSQVAHRACLLDGTPGRCEHMHALAELALGSAYRIDYTHDLAPEAAHRLLPRAVTHTGIDADLQAYVSATLRDQLLALAPYNVRDGAALVLDNQSGEALAYVGNAGPASNSPEVDGIRAPRQAGSTLKPFLYELALEERRITAATLLDDSPVNLSTPVGLYIPQDYDRDFRGWVSVRTALAASLNIPAVRTLTLVGPDVFVRRLRDLGFSTLDRDGDYYGYALALGSAEVSLWDLTNAYRTLANRGLYTDATLVADRPVPQSKRTMAGDAVAIVTGILADRSARATAFGLESPLSAKVPAAVKTGTSKDMRDNWCIGYTPRYTVGVWVGNMEGEPMYGVSGISGAGPAWQAIVHRLYADMAPTDFPQDKNLAARDIAIAGEGRRRELFLPGTEPTTDKIEAVDDRRPRIAYPPDGAILARDPDIPPASQAILLSAENGAGLVWLVDGKPGPAADREAVWRLRPGRHRFALARDGQEVDQASITVR